MFDRKRVLVIDDEDSIRNTLKTVLTEAGYWVIGAANGEEGLSMLESESFDLVITDILMPEKDGIETIIEIRKSRPDIKIIVISGRGCVDNFHPLSIAGKLGADIALAKPFQPEELLAVAERALGETPCRERAARGTPQ